MKDSQSDLYQASIEKLKQWNLRDSQINNILKKGKPIEDFVILSDFSGYVWEIKAEEGTHVKEGAPLFKIAELRSVWVDFDVYEKDLPMVKIGSIINFKIEGLTGKVFKAQTIFVSPVVNPSTRVATARVKLNNSDYMLKPGQYAWGGISVGSRNNIIAIPRTAVLWTGKRSLVYVQAPNIDEPQFELRQIVLGSKIGDNYVVIEGLELGENIVVEGAFTVDASAQLEGKPNMLQADGGKANMGHEGHSRVSAESESNSDNSMETMNMRKENKEVEKKHSKSEKEESKMKCSLGKCGGMQKHDYNHKKSYIYKN